MQVFTLNQHLWLTQQVNTCKPSLVDIFINLSKYSYFMTVLVTCKRGLRGRTQNETHTATQNKKTPKVINKRLKKIQTHFGSAFSAENERIKALGLKCEPFSYLPACLRRCIMQMYIKKGFLLVWIFNNFLEKKLHFEIDLRNSLEKKGIFFNF